MGAQLSLHTNAVSGYYDRSILDAGVLHTAERVLAGRRVSVTTAPAGPGLEHWQFSSKPLGQRGLRPGADLAGIFTIGIGDGTGTSDYLWVDPHTGGPDFAITLPKDVETVIMERYLGEHENGPALKFYSGAAITVLLGGTVKRARDVEFSVRFVGPQLLAAIPVTLSFTLFSSQPLSLRETEDHMADSSWIFL